MTAHDKIYGRRGGGWVDGDPTIWREEFARLRAENGGELRRHSDDQVIDDDQLALFE